MERVIGRYRQGRKGPLLFVIGGIHGNEESGIQAIQLLTKMLEVEPITNPEFTFQGGFVGILGNRQANAMGVRYIDCDLNRIWTKENVALSENKSHINLQAEHIEQREILECIEEEVMSHDPSEIVILDLHSTSSSGGIFTIPASDSRSLELAHALHAPVITHMLEELNGTTLHYFSNSTIHDIKCTAITFEAGQHADPLSVNRCIAAIINCMKSIGCVNAQDVEHIHDDILIKYSEPYPRQSRLIYKHDITPEDQFIMRSGYQNFQIIEKGEYLADDRNGPIHALNGGMILMPLYQKQGSEGFYIIEPVTEKSTSLLI